MRELIKVQDEKRIAKEKEAAELEAKRKSQECLNIEEKSIPQASIRSRKLRIDPTLRNFTISTKRISFFNCENRNSSKKGKHLDTQKGSLESSVKDPIPIPSESDVISDDDCDDDYQKRDDESLSEEEIQKDEFKYFSNPLYDLDDEIITNEKILPIKGFRCVIPNPPELMNVAIDSILMNFSSSDSRESNSEIFDATIESLFPYPIPVEDSDSLMEEVDLFLASDDLMPRGIEIDDYDSEGDICFLEELLSNDSPPLPENESFSLDHFDDPSLPRPPSAPAKITFDFSESPMMISGGNIPHLDVPYLHFYPP
ncbi:hypothetical protein Tco_0801523 [Tanacetum coccineum]|uniref:Uncharacterized protein n=1 Tax=Tanacetum coccineum TaxID=301880 RepID=A0ABQ5A066_9ASTR